jgi:hypothetical protein
MRSNPDVDKNRYRANTYSAVQRRAAALFRLENSRGPETMREGLAALSAEIKYSLSNAPADTPVARLAFMQGQICRFLKIIRAFLLSYRQQGYLLLSLQHESQASPKIPS